MFAAAVTSVNSNEPLFKNNLFSPWLAAKNKSTNPSLLKSADLIEVAPCNLFSNIPEAKTTTPAVEVKKTNQLHQSISNEVEKIVFFYKDGTFKEFKPN